ncbi:hypothetical protein [Thermoactinospora rubra]|uniref:hypothetical protein n=1 Tax=Thermoactinospora rubra TaxID=1088767 RepID=UPI000A11AF16|nr:hypothetical protein [Thermoactinospora rubra]
MRKIFAAAALTASIATGLAVAPAAAQATTAGAQTSTGFWGKYYSSNHDAYAYGKVFKSHGKVYTKWYGYSKDTHKPAYVWFKYYRDGGWHTKVYGWSGHKSGGTWGYKGIKKIYTWTCWGSKFDNCGGKHRIY